MTVAIVVLIRMIIVIIIMRIIIFVCTCRAIPGSILSWIGYDNCSSLDGGSIGIQNTDLLVMRAARRADDEDIRAVLLASLDGCYLTIYYQQNSRLNVGAENADDCLPPCLRWQSQGHMLQDRNTRPQMCQCRGRRKAFWQSEVGEQAI